MIIPFGPKSPAIRSCLANACQLCSQNFTNTDASSLIERPVMRGLQQPAESKGKTVDPPNLSHTSGRNLALGWMTCIDDSTSTSARRDGYESLTIAGQEEVKEISRMTIETADGVQQSTSRTRVCCLFLPGSAKD